jgi:hypothetical protein
MNWVSRSIPKHWQNFPLIGKPNRCEVRFQCEVRRFSATPRNWHASCKDIHEPAQTRSGAAKKEEGRTMKSMFAQAATFAFSAVAALAIFVGVIDQPQVLYDLAAATPAVSQLA